MGDNARTSDVIAMAMAALLCSLAISAAIRPDAVVVLQIIVPVIGSILMCYYTRR